MLGTPHMHAGSPPPPPSYVLLANTGCKWHNTNKSRNLDPSAHEQNTNQRPKTTDLEAPDGALDGGEHCLRAERVEVGAGEAGGGAVHHSSDGAASGKLELPGERLEDVGLVGPVKLPGDEEGEGEGEIYI